ncbi:hypothetical protein [Peribacillus frigoritolerans]
MSGRAVPQGTAFHFRNGIEMKGMTWHKRIGIVRTVREEVISVRADLVYGSRQFR